MTFSLLVMAALCMVQIPDDGLKIIINGLIVYFVNKGSRTLTLVYMVAHTLLCSLTLMPTKESY